MSVLFLHTSGEFISLESILKDHAKGETEYILGKEYVSSDIDFRRSLVEMEAPEIIVLGNSRALQYREHFFAEDLSFFVYLRVGSIDSLLRYIEEVETESLPKPKIIIMNLDQSYLIREPRADEITVVGDGVGEKLWLQIFTNNIKDILTGKITLFSLLSKKNEQISYIGARAFINNAGMRSDGSYRYGDTFPNYTYEEHEDFEFRDTLRQIERGINLFTQGEVPKGSSVMGYRDFLNRAETLGIHVVTVFPPYPPSVYSVMNERERGYAYIPLASAMLKEMHEEFEHTFHDFSDPETLDLRDHDFHDGVHGTDIAYARVILEAAANDSTLGELINEDEILAKLENVSEQDLYLFED